MVSSSLFVRSQHIHSHIHVRTYARTQTCSLTVSLIMTEILNGDIFKATIFEIFNRSRNLPHFFFACEFNAEHSCYGIKLSEKEKFVRKKIEVHWCGARLVRNQIFHSIKDNSRWIARHTNALFIWLFTWITLTAYDCRVSKSAWQTISLSIESVWLFLSLRLT